MLLLLWCVLKENSRTRLLLYAAVTVMRTQRKLTYTLVTLCCCYCDAYSKKTHVHACYFMLLLLWCVLKENSRTRLLLYAAVTVMRTQRKLTYTLVTLCCCYCDAYSKKTHVHACYFMLLLLWCVLKENANCTRRNKLRDFGEGVFFGTESYVASIYRTTPDIHAPLPITFRQSLPKTFWLNIRQYTLRKNQHSYELWTINFEFERWIASHKQQYRITMGTQRNKEKQLKRRWKNCRIQ